MTSMINLRSLFVLLAVGSILLAAVGLVRFAVDLWVFLHTSGAAQSDIHLNLRGLGGLLGGVALLGVFAFLYVCMSPRRKERPSDN